MELLGSKKTIVDRPVVAEISSKTQISKTYLKLPGY